MTILNAVVFLGFFFNKAALEKLNFIQLQCVNVLISLKKMKCIFHTPIEYLGLTLTIACSSEQVYSSA